MVCGAENLSSRRPGACSREVEARWRRRPAASARCRRCHRRASHGLCEVVLKFTRHLIGVGEGPTPSDPTMHGVVQSTHEYK